MGEKSNITRGKILRQFNNLAMDQGYSKTTIRQLSSICGMSLGHIRFYFSKKAELIWFVYLNFCRKVKKVISKMDLPNDPLLGFFFFQLVKCFISFEYEPISRLHTELSESASYINQRIKTCFEETKSVFQKIGLQADDEGIFIGSLSAIQSIYGFKNFCYTNDLTCDHEQIFRVFVNALFIQISFPQKDEYIGKTLQLFEQQDTNVLLNDFKDLSSYYFWEAERK